MGFSNELIRSLCRDSDEANLLLSPGDWQIVLAANKQFTESEEEIRGGEAWAHFLLSKAGLRKTDLRLERSLEVCCGNGFMYFSLRKLLQLPPDAYFIDLSRHQCGRFVQRCRALAVPPPNIICGDVGALPFADGSLSTVYGNSFLHHLPDVPHYLREFHRVLDRGGRLIVFHEPTPTATFWESFPLSLFKDTRTDSLTDIWAIPAETIEGILRRIGFRQIRIHASGIPAALLLTPFQIVGRKLHVPVEGALVATLKGGLARLETFFARKAGYAAWAPSIAIVAEK